MAYVTRRVALLIPTLFGVALLSFFLANVAPGDPGEEFARRINAREPTRAEIDAVRKELGLDRPLGTQFLSWMGDTLRGDLGVSFSSRRPVTTEMAERIPKTLELAVPATLLSLALALPLGTFMALYRNRLPDHAGRLFALAGASMPSFWLALLLILGFAVHFNLVPVAGRDGGATARLLPIVTLTLGPAAVLARFVRSSILEVLGHDFVRTARAKGLRRWQIVGRHAFRNALIPIVTAFGNRVGHLLAGAVVVETIFVWPGMGRLMADAAAQRDYPVIQGIVLVSGAFVVLVNLAVDLSYGLIDARVRLGRRVVATG